MVSVETADIRFTSMDEASDEQVARVVGTAGPYLNGLVLGNVLDMLESGRGPTLGYQIDRYTHSLQTATRALRDGRDEEYVICALLHDIGDTLGTMNHPDIAAAILKPFVSEENHWMVQHHGIFQGHYFFHHIGLDRDMRDNFKAHPSYERTAEFCELYDNPAFDARAETLPISEFMPMLQRVMAQPRQSIYKSAVQEQATA
jgi:predicted HD phosphohydrolase